jgi:hypothetical protein
MALAEKTTIHVQIMPRGLHGVKTSQNADEKKSLFLRYALQKSVPEADNLLSRADERAQSEGRKPRKMTVPVAHDERNN